MKATIKQEDFLTLLVQSIPDSCADKEILMAVARHLVIAPMRDPMADPVVKRAVRLYLRCNPEQAEPPSLPDLIRWLRGRGGMAYARDLEYRLLMINHWLDSFGQLSPDKQVTIDAGMIFAMRLLAGFEPLLHTASGKVSRKRRLRDEHNTPKG